VRLDVLVAGSESDFIGQGGSRRLLVPLDRFQVITNELLIERLLGPAGLVFVSRPESGGIGGQYFIGQSDLSIDVTKLKFCVGDDDAASGGVVRRLFINVERQIAKLRSQLFAD